VLIESPHGIDITDPGSIQFTISDSLHEDYQRDLSADTFRLVKLSDDADEQATLLWAIYDRSLETYMPLEYPFEAIILISIDAKDIAGNMLPTADYEFRIESQEDFFASRENLPQTAELDPDDPALAGVYDSGVQVTSGPLTGAKIVYNSSELLTPTFGSMDEMVTAQLTGTQAVGTPMNLLPHTVFNIPVKIFIPFAGYADVSELGLYYHDGVQWRTASDADGNLLPGGLGWMVPGSRVNHNDLDTPLIEIQAYHFSGTQGFVVVSSGRNTHETDRTSGTHAVISCFVDTANSGWKPGFWVLGLMLFIVAVSAIGVKSI
jgi:hypothetical protein